MGQRDAHAGGRAPGALAHNAETLGGLRHDTAQPERVEHPGRRRHGLRRRRHAPEGFEGRPGEDRARSVAARQQRAGGRRPRRLEARLEGGQAGRGLESAVEYLQGGLEIARERATRHVGAAPGQRRRLRQERADASGGFRRAGRPRAAPRLGAGRQRGHQHGIEHRTKRGVHGLEQEQAHGLVDARHAATAEAVRQRAPRAHPVVHDLPPVEEHVAGVGLELQAQARGGQAA